ncbi:hypothetical protein KIPB_012184, partial [Kipferlia bialata]
ADGVAGTDGVDGVNGADGAKGADGIDGTDGVDGADGAKGDTGPLRVLDYSTYQQLTSFTRTGTTYDFYGELNWYVHGVPALNQGQYCIANIEVATVDDPHTWLPVSYSRWMYSNPNFNSGMASASVQIQPDLYYRLNYQYEAGEVGCDFTGFLTQYESA